MSSHDDHIDPYYLNLIRQAVKMIGGAKVRMAVDIIEYEKAVAGVCRRRQQMRGARDATRKTARDL